jgi:polar amino acid transport system substrate-binding protein
MEIRQAVAIPKGRDIAFLRDLVEILKTNGFVADALARSGQDATVAEPA